MKIENLLQFIKEHGFNAFEYKGKIEIEITYIDTKNNNQVGVDLWLVNPTIKEVKEVLGY